MNNNYKNIRDCMIDMVLNHRTLIVFETQDEYMCNYSKLTSDDIVWMINNKFIIKCQDENYNLDYTKITKYINSECGSLINLFSNLNLTYNELVKNISEIDVDNYWLFGVVVNQYSYYTIKIGEILDEIYHITKYNSKIINSIKLLLTDDENNAFDKCMALFKQTIEEVVESDSNPLFSRSTSFGYKTLSTMFKMSESLGKIDTNEYRTTNYVLKKCMEELGELALEDNIAKGLSYKSQGSDGVAGEAVDLAICAMDMFALQYPDKNAKEIEHLFLQYMVKKIEKWKLTLDKE